MVAANIGDSNRFRRNLHIKPAHRIPAQGDHRQTHPVAGNRRADINAAYIIGRANPGPQVALLFDRQNAADIGNNPRKHLHKLPFTKV